MPTESTRVRSGFPTVATRVFRAAYSAASPAARKHIVTLVSTRVRVDDSALVELRACCAVQRDLPGWEQSLTDSLAFALALRHLGGDLPADHAGLVDLFIRTPAPLRLAMGLWGYAALGADLRHGVPKAIDRFAPRDVRPALHAASKSA